jgi:uncharacterized RDD family membrane protein YckC
MLGPDRRFIVSRLEMSDNERKSRVVATAGRLAFFPARVAARASRDQLATAADDVLIPELTRMIDRAFAGPLPEQVVQSAVRHRVFERIAAELVASGALDKAVNDALTSPHSNRLTEQLLHSDQMRQAIREVAESPEMRAALARQTTGLAEELVGEVRVRAVELDDRFDRRTRAAPTPFAGFATRALALAVDAALILLIFVSLAAMVGLVSTLVGTLRPQWLVGVLLASGWGLLAGGYFLLFWTGTGQTPGMRLLRLRLLGPDGRPPSLGRSVLRAFGTVVAIVPLFAGYLPVLFDHRRRGFPDFLAGTVVVYDLVGSSARRSSIVSASAAPLSER